MPGGKERRASLQSGLAHTLFAAIFIVILLVSFVSFGIISHSMNSQFEDKMDNTVATVNQYTYLVNKGLALYDSSYDKKFEESFSVFLKAYADSGNNPAAMDLYALQDEISADYNGDLDLYIINESGVIVYTTYEEDLYLDFRTWPEFYEEIDALRRGDEYVGDIATGGWTGEEVLKKYGYMPTPDHRYLLEIGLSSAFLEAGRKEFRHNAIRDLLEKQDSDVQSITFYDVVHRKVGEGVADPETDLLLDQVFSRKSDLEVVDTANQTVTRYVFISLQEEYGVSSSQMCLVAEIVFAKEDLNSSILTLFLSIALFVLLGGGLGIFAAYYIAYHFSRPIRSIITDIEQIAEGDLDHPIQVTKSAEAEFLRSSVSILVENLKNKIVLLKSTSEELEAELQERLKVEAELKESEEVFRRPVEQAPVGVFILQDGMLKYVNPRFCDILGYSFEELTRGISYLDLIIPEQRSEVVTILPDIYAGMKNLVSGELSLIGKDGNIVETETYASSLMFHGKPAIVGNLLDITEKKISEENLRRSLEEKNVLLGEVNHRVKNNLQIIVSLMGMQLEGVEDPEARTIIRDAINRVLAISLVHEQLYQDEHVTIISAQDHFETLFATIMGNSPPTIPVDYRIDCGSCTFALDQAVSLSLVIQELLTNSLKHAFTGRDSGTIAYSMECTPDEIVVTFSDDGIGLPQGQEIFDRKSLGASLIYDIVTKQLKGTIELIPKGRTTGTRYLIWIPRNEKE